MVQYFAALQKEEDVQFLQDSAKTKTNLKQQGYQNGFEYLEPMLTVWNYKIIYSWYHFNPGWKIQLWSIIKHVYVLISRCIPQHILLLNGWVVESISFYTLVNLRPTSLILDIHTSWCSALPASMMAELLGPSVNKVRYVSTFYQISMHRPKA